MTTPTLEQELQSVATGTDYRITIDVLSGSLYVRVHYAPAIRRVDMGGRIPVVLEDGCIATGHFAGTQRRRWRKATRLVLEAIEGHRAMLVATGVRQV